jgi:hypothetical protein
MKVLTRPGVLALAGCFALPVCLAIVGPDYQPPDLAAPDTYSTPAAFPAPTAPAAPANAAVDTALWWHGYDDPLLDALVDRALAGNLDVAAAGTRLAEARALVGVARAVGGPSLDADANADVDTLVAGNRRGSDTEGSADAGLAFSWMPDLFGGQHRRVEAAEGELRRGRRSPLPRDPARRHPPPPDRGVAGLAGQDNCADAAALRRRPRHPGLAPADRTRSRRRAHGAGGADRRRARPLDP